MNATRILFLSIFLSLAAVVSVNAAILTPAKTGEVLDNNLGAAATTGDNYDTTTDLEDIISTIIKIILSLLGAIFILLMFLAGNNWIQAAGNDEKVKKSKDTILNLLIGLTLILIAYALSSGFGGILSSFLLTK